MFWKLYKIILHYQLGIHTCSRYIWFDISQLKYIAFQAQIIVPRYISYLKQNESTLVHWFGYQCVQLFDWKLDQFPQKLVATFTFDYKKSLASQNEACPTRLLAESSLQADLNLITANRLERKNIEAKLEQSEAENRMLRESLNVADTKIKELTDQLARLQMQPSAFQIEKLWWDRERSSHRHQR